MSLFSGCGGLDLGLARAGFDVAFANDNDPSCVESYRANFRTEKIFLGSVADISADVVANVSRLDKGTTIDLLAGGPPCPPFSKSRFYRKEKPRALGDSLAEETLRGYLAVLRMLHPRAFLLENVPGLAYQVHREALDYILSAAKALGYSCSWKIVNAADYGVPQIRQRFFLVGTRGFEFEFPAPTHVESPGARLFDQVLRPWMTAGEAIGDLDTEENADDAGHFAGGKYHELLKRVPPGDNYLFFTEQRGNPDPVFRWRSRYWSFLLKLSPDLPAWTIQARRSNNMGPLHWRNRILRIEEIKRLQTFPDEWWLAGTIERQWRQVGNAVPPALAEHIGRSLARQLATAEEKGAGSPKATRSKRVLARAG